MKQSSAPCLSSWPERVQAAPGEQWHHETKTTRRASPSLETWQRTQCPSSLDTSKATKQTLLVKVKQNNVELYGARYWPQNRLCKVAD